MLSCPLTGGPWDAKGAEGFLEAGNMPIRPTPSYPTQRAGPGPGMQHPAKTTNCNYLRKCFSFEFFFFFFLKRGKKKQDRRFETTPRKPNADMVKDVGTEYAIQIVLHVCVCMCLCV